MKSLIGLHASRKMIVGKKDTASYIGSGTVDVLATPRLLAWLEQVTLEVVELNIEEGLTSVGTGVSLQHRRASAVGDEIQIEAAITEHEKKFVELSVKALSAESKVLAEGSIKRSMVDMQQFSEANRPAE